MEEAFYILRRSSGLSFLTRVVDASAVRPTGSGGGRLIAKFLKNHSNHTVQCISPEFILTRELSQTFRVTSYVPGGSAM